MFNQPSSDPRSQLFASMANKLKEASEKIDLHNDPIEWIKREFFIPETKNDPRLRGHLELQPYQEAALREALARDENGDYKYSIIVWSDIKKSIKSTIAAAVNLARAHATEWGEFYIVANDLKQADSRVARYIRRSLILNPKTNPKNNRDYRTNGYRIDIPNGSFLEAIPIDPSGEAGSNADQITWSELWGSNEKAKENMWCFDEDTEILTQRGWVNYKSALDSDYFATRNLKSGKFEWQKPSGIYRELYQGEMWLYKSNSLEMCVTPNHRVLGKFSKTDNSFRKFLSLDWEIKTIEEAIKFENFWICTTSDGWDGYRYAEKYIVVPPTSYQDEIKIPIYLWVEFMAWYLSEGCISSKRSVIITQSKKVNPENHKEIIDLLDMMGFSPKVYENGKSIVVHHKGLAGMLTKYGHSRDKYIPYEVKNQPKWLLEKFIEIYTKGDGSVDGNRIQISSNSERMIDDFTEIGQKCGYYVSTSEVVDHRFGRPIPSYRIRLMKSDFRRNKKSRKSLWKKINYSGQVWCPSTSNGVVYVRRNGTYHWSGNSEMTLSPTKQGRSFRFVESYAGFAEESELLYSLYEIGVKRGEQLWPDRTFDVTEGEPKPLELFVNRDARMLCLWNTMPRNPWQTKAYYAAEAAVLPPNQFQRMHRNQWVSSTETFVPMEWWHSCRRSDVEWPELDKSHHSFIITLDAAVSGAALGLWMGCRHPLYNDQVLEVFAAKWEPTGSEHKIDFYGTDNNPGMEKVLRRLIYEYNVIEVAYDEFQLHSFCSRLKQEHLAWFRSFPQGNERLVADSLFRDMIRERRYWHRGNPDMAQHVQNADAKIDPEDRKIRIVKRAERLNVDLAVCASMGCRELMRLNL